MVKLYHQCPCITNSTSGGFASDLEGCHGMVPGLSIGFFRGCGKARPEKGIAQQGHLIDAVCTTHGQHPHWLLHVCSWTAPKRLHV